MIEAQDIKPRVRWWQTKLAPLGLQHWIFTIEVLDVDEPWTARVNTSLHYATADLQFKKSFLDSATKHEFDQVIVHELMHVLFRDLDQTVALVVQDLGGTARELMEHTIDAQSESVVDRLAHAIVKLVH